MCWSFTASAGMVVAGTAATAWSIHKRQPAVIPATLGYFTAMEALQTAGYLVIGACGTRANQVITVLSYLHIVFQPLVINAFAMHLLPQGVTQRIRWLVYLLCAASSAFMLVQLLPLDWAGQCRIGQPMCGAQLCLRAGSWHIAWDIPYNGLTKGLDTFTGHAIGFPTYILAVFVLPVLYGAWRFTLFHALVGPILAFHLTQDVNEAPAVWCLFSIAILLVALLPGLLRQFTVERWILWPAAWQGEPGR